MEYSQAKGHHIAVLIIVLIVVIPLSVLWHRGYSLQRVSGADQLYQRLRHKCGENQTEEPVCVPDAHLRQMLDNPDECEESVIILQCHNPCLHFLFDRDVYKKCGVKDDDVKNYKQRFPEAPADKTYTKISLTKKKCEKTEMKVSDRIVLVKEKSYPRRKVPNIVHYINVECRRNFNFMSFVSVMSVWKFIRPVRIYFHGHCAPVGKWWKKVLKEVPNIYFRRRKRLQSIHGRKPETVKQESDVVRLQVMLEEGGIYLDPDVIILKPVENLLDYPLSLGKETSTMTYLGSGLMLAQPRSPFVCVWLQAYREHSKPGRRKVSRRGGFHELTPGVLAGILPGLVHIEETSINRPNWAEMSLIYHGFFDWRGNYALHLWASRAGSMYPKGPEDIPAEAEVRSTVQEITRYILYGEKRVRALKQFKVPETTEKTRYPNDTYVN